MTLTASLLLDLVLLGLLVVFFLVGYQRGLILTLCSLLAVVLSFAGGWYLATHAAEGFQAKLGPEVPGFVVSSLLFLAGFLVVQIVWVTLCHALNLVAKLPGAASAQQDPRRPAGPGQGHRHSDGGPVGAVRPAAMGPGGRGGGELCAAVADAQCLLFPVREVGNSPVFIPNS